MKTPLKISLYIPVYNAVANLPEVLRAIEELTLQPDEILIIDDGSTDGSSEVASNYDVKIIRKYKNQGLAAARNTAIKEARNNLIACIDSDVLVEAEWLKELSVFLQKHPEYSAVAGRLDEKFHHNLADKWRKKHMQQHWGRQQSDNIPFLFGANGLYRKQALIEIGGFNPLFHTNGEDSNICRRLKEAGHKIAYLPSAKCWHLKRDTVPTLLRAYWKWMRHPICIEWPIDNWTSLAKFCKRRFMHHLKFNFIPDLKSLKIDLTLINLLIFVYTPFMEIKEFFLLRQKKSKINPAKREA